MKSKIFTKANFITVLRILLTPLFIYFLFGGRQYFEILALLIFILASITDAYDGYIARKYSEVTKLGKFLDPLADKVLMSAAFISFVVMGLVPLWMVILVILRRSSFIHPCIYHYPKMENFPGNLRICQDY